jgi:hypothetical protein
MSVFANRASDLRHSDQIRETQYHPAVRDGDELSAKVGLRGNPLSRNDLILEAASGTIVAFALA